MLPYVNSMRNGQVGSIGTDEVSIDDSEAVKDLYGHGNDIEKANHYWALKPSMDYVFVYGIPLKEVPR